MSLLKGLPVEHFACITADPPWHYRTWSNYNQGRATSTHYSLMEKEEIIALPVKHVAAENALLFLWVTNPMLQDGLDTLRAWGFDYSTVAFTWAKTSRSSNPTWAPKWHMGLGYWTRANSEICLLGVRGQPKRISKGVRQLLIEPVREHSRKPDIFYSSVERLCAGPRLDLFGRQLRSGWEVRGNQVDKFQPETAQAAPEPRGEAFPQPVSQTPPTPKPAPAASASPPGPNAVSLLAKLRASAGRVGPIPKLTPEAMDE